TDSRIILDEGGAEKLLGKGDMLFRSYEYRKCIRIQGCFVSDRERQAVIDFLKGSVPASYDEDVIKEIDRKVQQAEKASTPEDGGDMEDELLPQAVEVVLDAGQASATLLQRHLRLGYARAARLIDQLNAKGIVGEYEGSKPRKVLIMRQQWLEMQAMKEPDSHDE
ncbi:MAG: DNA translocase FtsK, partial [Clostridia bacterium]|nr:DNA translocase FtsK [Clostridia bacterium]